MTNKAIRAEIYKDGKKWYKKTFFANGETHVEEMSLPIVIYNKDGSVKYQINE